MVRKLLKILRGDAGDQVFDVCVSCQSCLDILEGVFDVTDIHVDRLVAILITLNALLKCSCIDFFIRVVII